MEHILVPCVPYTQTSSHSKQGCRVESWAGCPMGRGSPEPHGPSVLEPGWHQHVQPCSQGWQNKAPQTGWLKMIERYSFAVLEAQSLILRHRQGHPSPEGTRGESFLASSCRGGCLWPSPLLQSCPRRHLAFLPCVCLSLCVLSSFYKDPSYIGFRGPP